MCVLDLPSSGTAELWINSSNWKLGSRIFLDNCHLSKITDSWGNFQKVFCMYLKTEWSLELVNEKTSPTFLLLWDRGLWLRWFSQFSWGAKNPTASFHLLKATSKLFCYCFSSSRSLPLLPDSAAKPEALLVLCGCCWRTGVPWRTRGMCFLWFAGVFK